MLILFQHLMKTAGTTLRAVIERQYPPEAVFTVTEPDLSDYRAFLALPEERRREIRVVMGHTAFQLHRDLTEPHTGIVVLRDPVDRVLSHYHYVRKTAGDPNHALANALSLEDFIRAGRTQWLGMENMQTWLLSWPDLSESPAKTTFCPPELLDQALGNLRARFVVVGLTERFDDSVLLMRRRLGWTKLPLYARLQVTDGRPAKETVPPGVLELIREHNQLDQILYDEALALLDAAIIEEGPAFDEDRAVFEGAQADLDRWLGESQRELARIRAARDQAIRERDSARENLDQIQASRLWRLSRPIARVMGGKTSQ